MGRRKTELYMTSGFTWQEKQTGLVHTVHVLGTSVISRGHPYL